MKRLNGEFKPLTDDELKKMIKDIDFDPDKKNPDSQDVDDELLINQIYKDFSED